jgi:DNA-binding NarL/FixJ family response regulator
VNRSLNILIAEPSELISLGVTAILNGHNLKAQYHGAESIDDIHRLLTGKTIDIVIANPSLVQNNVRAFNSLRSLSVQTRWIALIYAYHDERLLSLFDASIAVNDQPEKIISLIRGLVMGEDSDISARTDAGLSDREIDVLRLLASGLATKEIADTLNISTNTVNTHRKNISVKTGIKSVSGLTIYAVVKKFITLGGVTG